MRLLKITDQELPVLDEYFETVERVSVDSLTPEVVDGVSDVRFEDQSVLDYDCVYAEIPGKNALFGRVALEIIEESGVDLNYSSTGFYLMSKKNYLYHVLHEKGIPATKAAVVPTQKAVRNVENYLRGPLIARRFEDGSEVERAKLDKVEELSVFAEGIDRENKFVIFQGYNKGDKLRILVIGDDCISLADNSEEWDFSEENLQYRSISQEKRDIAIETRKGIGTSVAEVLIRGDKVEDVNPNPDLEMYANISGKDVYRSVAQILKGEEK